MTNANIARLHQIQTMLVQLIESVSDQDCQQQFHPELPSIGWYLARSVYLETWLIREWVQQDDSMTQRIRHLFAHDVVVDEKLLGQLPPKEHLLNWATELQEENLTRLANPGVMLGDSPRLSAEWLVTYLVQSHAIIYEKILTVLHARTLQQVDLNFLVSTELLAAPGDMETTHISQGHYRIGAREKEITFDNEQPSQMIELSNYRIAVNPVNNAQYLAFMEAGGYEQSEHWSEDGWQWNRKHPHHPWHWRKNLNGRWFAVGLNGPSALNAEEPLAGINHHEALAFCHWLATVDDKFSGAVVQHEYQWEVAARLGVIKNTGKVREWCANGYQHYSGYQTPEIDEIATTEFDGQHIAIKGVSLHTQPSLRRASLRTAGLAHQQHLNCGTRLVFPPGKPFWEQ